MQQSYHLWPVGLGSASAPQPITSLQATEGCSTARTLVPTTAWRLPGAHSSDSP